MAVAQEAYVEGVSTRRVDGLVQALGMTGIAKSHNRAQLLTPRLAPHAVPVRVEAVRVGRQHREVRPPGDHGAAAIRIGRG